MVCMSTRWKTMNIVYTCLIYLYMYCFQLKWMSGSFEGWFNKMQYVTCRLSCVHTSTPIETILRFMQIVSEQWKWEFKSNFGMWINGNITWSGLKQSVVLVCSLQFIFCKLRNASPYLIKGKGSFHRLLALINIKNYESISKW